MHIFSVYLLLCVSLATGAPKDDFHALKEENQKLEKENSILKIKNENAALKKENQKLRDAQQVAAAAAPTPGAPQSRPSLADAFFGTQLASPSSLLSGGSIFSSGDSPFKDPFFSDPFGSPSRGGPLSALFKSTFDFPTPATSNLNAAADKLNRHAAAQPFMCDKGGEGECVCTSVVKGVKPSELKVESTGTMLTITGGRSKAQEGLEDSMKAAASYQFQQQLQFAFEPQGEPHVVYNTKNSTVQLTMTIPPDGACKTTSESFSESKQSAESDSVSLDNGDPSTSSQSSRSSSSSQSSTGSSWSSSSSSFSSSSSSSSSFP